LLKHVFIEVIH